VALWTPTDASGRLDETGLRANLVFLRDKGIAGWMLLGSTGEFLRVDLEERLRFLEFVKPLTGGLPAMVNVSDARLPGIVALGRRAGQLGFDSISLLPPWFFPQTQADLAEFYVRCAEAIGLPMFLYNFPERTGNRIDLPTIAAVADRVQVVGVKQSGAEFDYHRDLAALGREKGFVLLSGGEPRLAEAMALGATGCVSGMANVVPELIVALYQAARRGDRQAIEENTARVVELANAINRLQFPVNVAAAMEARGLAVGEPKLPLSPATVLVYQETVAEARRLYRAWKLN